MLSYPIGEAEELLANKLSAAKQSHSNCEEDLDFLREQITGRKATPMARGRGKSGWLTDMCADDGGGDSACLQLGRGTKAERQGRRRPRK